MTPTHPEAAGTVVVALGGNAILQPGQTGTFEEQLVNVDAAMRRLAELVETGWRVVLTHGNGPQVGNLLIQNALAAKTVAPMPMDVCGAESQGQIGYMLEQTLMNHLRKRRLRAPVVTLLTEVAVSAKDPAFARPSKPVGPFYSEVEARTMMLEHGLAMREDAGRGWRRVVPSPEPREIVPRDAIRALLDGGACVICSGGGGVPVVRSASGALSGIDAVIDKDLAAALLAREVSADVLVILTDVSNAYIAYGTPHQRALGTVSVAEMEAYAADGQFKAGSMGPKVDACLRFARAGGTAVISGLTEVVPAVRGDAGTRIVPEDAAAAGRGRPKPQTGTKAKAGGGKTTGAGGKGKAAGKSHGKGGGKGKKKAARRETQGPEAVVIDLDEARRRASRVVQ